MREHFGVDAPRSAVGTGAASAAGERAFVLLDGGHGLGAALAWARRVGADEVHVVVDDRPGHVARQAAEFRTPVTVWSTSGRSLVPVEPAAPHAPPDARPSAGPDAGPGRVSDGGIGPPDAPELVAGLEEQGLDVVVEGDRLAGEFRGLEVARIVRALDDGEPILEVGVGRFDRELTAMMRGELPDSASISRVVEQLRELRRPGGPNHPLTVLVPERWLRHTLLAEPARVGCDALVAAPTPVPRDRLRERGVAAAVGTRAGEPVVVACTVGVDLEAVVLAADARRFIAADATLLVALPERDVLAVNRALVDDLVRPAELAPISGDWRT